MPFLIEIHLKTFSKSTKKTLSSTILISELNDAVLKFFQIKFPSVKFLAYKLAILSATIKVLLLLKNIKMVFVLSVFYHSNFFPCNNFEFSSNFRIEPFSSKNTSELSLPINKSGFIKLKFLIFLNLNFEIFFNSLSKFM